jgi:MFS family permease
MIIVYAVLAFAIAYFILRNSGGIIRHLIAFIFGALVAAILTQITFELTYPLGYSASRNKMMGYYFLAGAVAAVLGPIAGMLVAWFRRRRRNRNPGREATNAT